METSTESKKSHNKRHAGRKAEKKLDKKQKEKVVNKKPNPKAFSIQSIAKTSRIVRRTLDIKEKKHHLPVVDRTPIEPPPILVAVIGPPKVGKTTLINCLLKHFVRQKLANVFGPVTVVSGKNRRITFIECNNDINSMIDLAKICDLALLLIDASFGFEMEIFEFLNICQVHGFPKIMGVLTHLDHFKQNKQLSKMKKRMKHRFWTEVYQGAKLFYLSGLSNDEYPKTEIHNLCRFISVMKFRPLQWKITHPFLLADRMEDITDPETIRQNPKADRSVCLYGYVRGTNFKKGSFIHIPGCGDYMISDITFLSDPCPLPNKEKKRTLDQKERLIYAPMAGVGGIVYDKDAVYIDLGGSHSHTKEPSLKPKNDLVNQLTKTQYTLNEKIEKSQLKIFSKSNPISADNLLTSDEESEEDSDNSIDSDNTNDSMSILQKDDDQYTDETKIDDDADDDNDEDYNDEGIEWKNNMEKKAYDAFLERKKVTENMKSIVYDNKPISLNQPTSISDVGGLFTKKPISNAISELDEIESSKVVPIKNVESWNDDDLFASIKDCFVTGKWEEDKDAEMLLAQDDSIYGDFEDMETGQKFSQSDYAIDSSNSEKNDSDDDEFDGSENNDISCTDLKNESKINNETIPLTPAQKREIKIKEKRDAKKKRMKELFDSQYDAIQSDDKGTFFDDLKQEFDQQAQLNRTEFDSIPENERADYEGFRPGLYVRILLQGLHCEFVDFFDPCYPLIIGGLMAAEQNIGYVNVRIKKHRWHRKILKTNDPLIISLGWRRFQTVPLYCLQDHNMRRRLLKYTPEHLHCHASFWGPVTPQGSGFLAIQSIAGKTAEFRIAATGTVVELDKSTNIVKKLKLTGTPFKVYKKTAFIEGMFSSSLETAKFEGALLRSVSGLRGQIKKALNSPIGSFRATFEDQIKLSDIVFVRTWYPVDPPRLYNPVTNLLLSPLERSEWRGMKTLGELKRERNIRYQPNVDSLYKDIHRTERIESKLIIPKSIQRDLPFKDKPKVDKPIVDNAENKRIAVIRDARDQRVSKLMTQLKTLHDDKMKKRRSLMHERVSKHKKQIAKSEEKRMARQKEVKKKVFRVLGQMEKKKRKFDKLD